MTADAVTPVRDAGPAGTVGGWATSASIDKLAFALTAALGELTNVPTDRTAAMGTYSYRYADLGSALAVVRPVLARHALAVVQTPEVDARGFVVVTTTLFHSSGQWLAAPPLRLPGGNTAQSVGSAITYARRYTLLAVLGMATVDDDDDGAAASEAATEQGPLRSDAEPVLMPARYVVRFREALVEHGLDGDDGASIVSVATGGRTDDVELVWLSETQALADALADYRARTTERPAESPPDTPDGLERPAEPEPAGIAP